MAIKGSVTTNDYSGRYYKVSWTASQSIENNQSVISWTLEAAGGGSAWYAERTLNVVIAGNTVYDKTARVERYAGQIASGTITLQHDTEGNRSFAISVRAAVYGTSVNCTGSSNFTLDAIARKATILTAPNFNDEENPTITYSNPAGNKVQSLQACISLTGATDNVEYRDIPKTGNSYTFELTDAERRTLLAATDGSNSRTVVFYVKTIIDGVTYYSPLIKTFSVVNASPRITPSVKDTNSATITLTGNNQKFVKYHSNLSYTLSFETLKEAGYKSCQVVCGSQTRTTLTGEFQNIENDSITFILTDSRNNTVFEVVSLDMIDYITPTCNLQTSFELETETTARINLKVTGKCFYGSFGALDNDPTIMYRYKVDNGEYGSWTYYSGDAPTYQNNEYSIDMVVGGLNYLNTYTVQARIVDWLGSVDSNEELVKIIPVFDWGENDFNFNVPVIIQGNTINDFVIERGTSAMGSNGTWYWEKWASGKATCCGCRNYGNTGMTMTWGSLYHSDTFTQSFPSGLFIEAPSYIGITINRAGDNCWIINNGLAVPNKDETGTFNVANATKTTISQVYINFNVIGRWK